MNKSKSSHIQFGCGMCCPSEWRNFDASPVLRLKAIPVFGIRVAGLLGKFPDGAEHGDIVKGLPISNASVDAIYCSHVLEHLWRDECAVALANTYHYLKPGGLFRLVVPDLSRLATAYLGDPDSEAGLRFVGSLHLVGSERPVGLVAFLRSYWGRSHHRWMWDYGSLVKYLREAGFTKIREAELGDSQLEVFSSVEEGSRFEYSVCIECEK